MFCDKDQAEIRAITATWGEHTLRLCFWHLKRAVDKKLASKRGRLGQIYDVVEAQEEFSFVDAQFLPNINNNATEANVILCVAVKRKEVLNIMHRHYCHHPLISHGTVFKSASEIRYDSAKEMYNFCVENELNDAWAYLYRRWYTSEMWKLWARSVVDHIPNGKSTMLIESHWRVLKRNHLHFNNRPRLDYLVYTITQKQCTDLLFDYNQKVVLRRDFFQWERDFQSRWNRSLTQDVSVSDYATNVDQWVCGCPTFFVSRFLICKHLTQTSRKGYIQLGQKFIKRQLYPPFIVIMNGTLPNSNHPGSVDLPYHDNVIVIASSDSDDDGEGDVEDAAGSTEDADEVDVEGREFLAMEVALQDNRRRKRELMQMLDENDGEFARLSGNYVS